MYAEQGKRAATEEHTMFLAYFEVEAPHLYDLYGFRLLVLYYLLDLFYPGPFSPTASAYRYQKVYQRHTTYGILWFCAELWIIIVTIMRVRNHRQTHKAAPKKRARPPYLALLLVVVLVLGGYLFWTQTNSTPQTNPNEVIVIDQPQLPLTQLLEVALKAFHKLSPLLRLGFGQHFFALFPTQSGLFQ